MSDPGRSADGGATAVYDALPKMFAEQRAQALNDAADYITELAKDGWGGNAAWFTTGNKVGALVSDVLRQLAEEQS